MEKAEVAKRAEIDGERNVGMQNVKDKNVLKQVETSCFLIKQYISSGEELHFYRDVVIHAIVRGEVVFNIMGERRKIVTGQIAIVNSLENHSYEVNGEAEMLSIYLGKPYLRNFLALYSDMCLPSWLMDVEYNKSLYQYFESLLEATKVSALGLERIGLVHLMLSDIVEHYGIEKKFECSEQESDLITRVVQYIYEHYNEKITLDTLAEVFYMSPKTLGAKLGKRLKMDLRAFINDIRVQKAIQMRDNPEYSEKSLDEIAAICGFNNMNTFYRCYERNFSFDKEEEDKKV